MTDQPRNFDPAISIAPRRNGKTYAALLAAQEDLVACRERLAAVTARAEAAEATIQRVRKLVVGWRHDGPDDGALVIFLDRLEAILDNRRPATPIVDEAMVERLRKLTYASDDGSEHEHDHVSRGGDVTCPACWGRRPPRRSTGGVMAHLDTDGRSRLRQGQRIRVEIETASHGKFVIEGPVQTSRRTPSLNVGGWFITKQDGSLCDYVVSVAALQEGP